MANGKEKYEPMNHKWKDNRCTICGIEREKKNYRKKVRTESVLRNGIWDDKNIYSYGVKWYYGKESKFKRPSCFTESSPKPYKPPSPK